MDTPNRIRTRRTPGAFRAAWLAALVLSLGLFGPEAGALKSSQSSTEAFSGEFDPVIGAPSSAGLSALSNWLRSYVEGGDDSDDVPTATGLLPVESGYLSKLVGGYGSPSYPSSPHQLNHSPRAPPLV